jgi:hypothetical protein
MSYLTQSEIASNGSMISRVAQAATEEGAGTRADQWTTDYRRVWAAAPGWDDAWESSRASHPDDVMYDPGADEAVITDGMILSQVQSMALPPTSEPSALPAGPEALPTA